MAVNNPIKINVKKIAGWNICHVYVQGLHLVVPSKAKTKSIAINETIDTVIGFLEKHRRKNGSK